MDIQEISDLIYNKILNKKEELTAQFNASKGEIGYFYIDDLLPEALAEACFKRFPEPSEMRILKSMKEYKHVSAQMDKHDPFLEQVIYAFQDPKIVSLIGEICDIENLYPDDS